MNTFKNRLDKHWRGHPMRLDYKDIYGPCMQSPAYHENKSLQNPLYFYLEIHIEIIETFIFI